ncbi:MAG: S9 family peptidase, partial [Bacteroidota bacterium]
MLRNIILCVLCASTVVPLSAQKKKITLEEIWNGTFRTERMEVLRSMKDGQHYTVLNYERSPRKSRLDKYAYASLEKVETILESSGEVPFFTSYTFSKDESKILLATEIEYIFRRSTLGVFYVYDIGTKSLVQVAEDKIQ